MRGRGKDTYTCMGTGDEEMRKACEGYRGKWKRALVSWDEGRLSMRILIYDVKRTNRTVFMNTLLFDHSKYTHFKKAHYIRSTTE